MKDLSHVGAAMLIVVATFLVVGCADPSGAVGIDRYSVADDDRSLEIEYGTVSGGEFVSSSVVDETADAITVEIRATEPRSGVHTADIVGHRLTLSLDSPLGGREVIDASSDAVVPRVADLLDYEIE